MKEYIREFTTRDIIQVRHPAVVVIGGGTGLSSILRGLKDYTSKLTAVVTMGDDGGSSGRLRDDLGLLPPGDIRNCILALADDENVMQQLFNYRFESGELGGHNFGNLFLAAMDGISEDFFQAIQRTSDVLHITGRVLPVSLDPMVLTAELEDGTKVEGESLIPEVAFKTHTPIKRLYLKDAQNVRPLKDTLQAIKEANIIIFGPGSLYTSIISNLLVPGIVQAIKESSAQTYYMGNLMTQPGETDGFDQEAHVKTIEDHAGGLKLFDTIIEHTGIIPENLEKLYARNYQIPVRPIESGKGYNILKDDLAYIDSGNLIRHNAKRAAEVLFEHYLKRRKAE